VIQAPLKTPGGKAPLAQQIIGAFPPHLHYVEPYAGGLGVLLAKDPEGVSEVVNDVDGRLTNFWVVLADHELFRLFERTALATPFCQARWEAARDYADLLKQGARRGDGPIGRVTDAVEYFVLVRQSFAGRRKSFAPLSRTRTRRGMNEQASAWMGAVDGLREVHTRLRRVVILNDDALRVIEQQDGPMTLQYMDPPYMLGTRTTPDHYEHEMTDQHHHDLIDLVKTLKSKVVISTYPNSIYEGGLSQWNRLDMDVPNQMSASARKRRMTERLYMNYEPPRPPEATSEAR
jgi:DNA adenine methylase